MNLRIATAEIPFSPRSGIDRERETDPHQSFIPAGATPASAGDGAFYGKAGSLARCWHDYRLSILLERKFASSLSGELCRIIGDPPSEESCRERDDEKNGSDTEMIIIKNI